jgi:hypothetical protein
MTPKDDLSSRVSDTALRKKKNADAQAAFRARRANYIATLEETGLCPLPFQYTSELSYFISSPKSQTWKQWSYNFRIPVVRLVRR